jgi:hypothetical protein
MELLQGVKSPGLFDPPKQLLLGINSADTAREAAFPTQPVVDHPAERWAMPAALLVVHGSRRESAH